MAPPKPKEVAKAPAAPAGGVAKVKRGLPRNYDLGNGIVRFSKTKMFHKKAKYKFVGKKNPKAEKPKKPTVVVKQIGGEKNGGTRTVLLRRRKSFYPTQDKIRTRSHHKTFSKHVRRTRPNLTVGTVCILLAGRHAGKRVVLLGVLPSGLLLVTGPFAFNSCPLRRIPQRYVIGTSTKVDLGDFKLPAHLDDDYFKKNKKSTKRSVKRKTGEDIFASKKRNTCLRSNARPTRSLSTKPSSRRSASARTRRCCAVTSSRRSASAPASSRTGCASRYKPQ